LKLGTSSSEDCGRQVRVCATHANTLAATKFWFLLVRLHLTGRVARLPLVWRASTIRGIQVATDFPPQVPRRLSGKAVFRWDPTGFSKLCNVDCKASLSSWIRHSRSSAQLTFPSCSRLPPTCSRSQERDVNNLTDQASPDNAPACIPGPNGNLSRAFRGCQIGKRGEGVSGCPSPQTMQLVLFTAARNKTVGPCLAAMHRTLFALSVPFTAETLSPKQDNWTLLGGHAQDPIRIVSAIYSLNPKP
jgi:hypothetical protein